MKIIIFIIILIIIFIILCNIDKNINDNFINYQMSKMGKNTKDIKIHGRNINIETNNSNLNVNKLCIDDACLNMINEETLPREQGPQGVCTDNDCYYCTCNNGQPADIGTGPNSCKKKKSDSDTEQCKSCKLGYQLNSEKKCVLCTSNTYNGRGGGVPFNTYNDNPFNTGSCKICQGCPAGQRRINCGGENPGTCAQNTCSCSNGTEATGSACTVNGAIICNTCHKGYKLVNKKCVVCTPGTFINVHNHTRNTCQNWKTCPSSTQYKSGNGTRTNDVSCTPCSTVKCPSNTYEASRTCKDGPVCPPCKSKTCPGGQYKISNSNWSCSGGIKCKNCFPCNRGERETRSCHTNHNRVCSNPPPPPRPPPPPPPPPHYDPPPPSPPPPPPVARDVVEAASDTFAGGILGWFRFW